MSPNPPSSLRDFLVSSKAQYLHDVRMDARKASEEWTVVMGNEAGDLDSLASSIVYAFLSSSKMLPFIQTPRSSLPLRPENLYALSLAGINHPEEELFLSDDLLALNSQSLFPTNKFVLVDHNRLGNYHRSPIITSIIDHHTDEGLYTSTARPRIIEPAGSCASLITREVVKPLLSPPLPAVSTLLLSSILLDTSGLKPAPKGKALDVDQEAAKFLISVLSSSSLSSNPNSSSDEGHTWTWSNPSSLTPDGLKSLSSTLSSLKSSVSHLSAGELLRRDYKEYEFSVPLWGLLSDENNNQKTKVNLKAGLSTVPLPLSSFVQGKEGEPGLLETGSPAKQYMRERGLSVLGILTSFVSTQSDADTEISESKKGKKEKKDAEDKESKKKHKKPKHQREMAWFILTGSSLLSFNPPSNWSWSHFWSTLETRLWTGLHASEELDVQGHPGFTEFIEIEDQQATDTLRIRIFFQNPSATRKVTAPVLRAILEGV